jgi:hypothetical protein
MRSDPPCPACAGPGRLIGEDDQDREFFACLTAGCEVVEYDREAVRHRKGERVRYRTVRDARIS